MNPKISESHRSLAKVPHEEIKPSSPGITYSEIPGLTDPTLDVLNQLSSNIQLLSDLHQRLQFTIREIKTVIR